MIIMVENIIIMAEKIKKGKKDEIYSENALAVNQHQRAKLLSNAIRYDEGKSKRVATSITISIPKLYVWLSVFSSLINTHRLPLTSLRHDTRACLCAICFAGLISNQKL